MEVGAFGYSNPSFANDGTTCDETSEPKTSPSVRPEENNPDIDQNSKNRSNSRSENETSEGETLKRNRSSNPLQINSKGDAKNYSNFTHNKSCCMNKKIFGVAVVVCLLTAFFGVVMLAGGYDAMFDAILKTQMEVKPGSRAYDIWKDTPVPLSLSFYLFNLTNPEEFQNGAKPNVSEVGPYVYREYHEKTDLTFNDNNTVTFYQQRWWVWDQEASGDQREDDQICILNTVPVSAAYSVRDHDWLLSGLNFALNEINETLTPVFSAKDILFDGYEDPLLDLVSNFSTEHTNNTSGYPIDGNFLEDLFPPGLLDYDKMAWFYKRNLSETYDGLYNMFTGTDTLDHLGNIDWWNKMNDTEYYMSPCNGIFGSAGEIWPPYQTATNISFWCSDMCSTLTLMYKENIADEFGLEGFRYWADEKTFAAPDKVPENICYCYEEESANCPLSGLRDAQTCRMGSPAYISFPHFLHGDPALTEAINGLLEPDEDRDQLYIDMIPELGVPMDVRARMQINMQVQPYPGERNLFHTGRIDLLANVREVVMPLLWFEVKAGLTKELAAELKPVVFLMRTPTMTIIWSLMIVGGISGFLLLSYQKFKH